MHKITYVNGRFVNHENAMVHVEDRGYQFADAVYEVVLARKKVLIDWEPHFIRLVRSLTEIKINYVLASNSLKSLVLELMERNNLSDAMVYIQVSRGTAPRNHSFPNPTQQNITPNIVITVTPPAAINEAQYQKGVSLITAPDIRWKRRDIKTVGLLANVLAKAEADSKNAADALFIEDSGAITETSSANFFIFDEAGNLWTHPKNNLILAGITRQGIIDTARATGIKVIEEAFTLGAVFKAKAAFVSSTTKHILPVTMIDGQVIGSVSAELKQLMQNYTKYIEQYINDNQKT